MLTTVVERPKLYLGAQQKVQKRNYETQLLNRSCSTNWASEQPLHTPLHCNFVEKIEGSNEAIACTDLISVTESLLYIWQPWDAERAK